MAVKYSASDLRRAATIYEKSFETDTDFEEVTTLVNPIEVRGKLMPVPGRERMRANQLAGEPKAMFVIRERDWLTDDHILVIAGKYYEIHSIVDVEGRFRFQELLITESENDYVSDLTNQAPVSVFSFSATLLAVDFTDESTDADGSVSAWLWDFGDGFASFLENPSHTYAAAGSYVVKLTVTDNDGASHSSTQNITVSENAPPISAFSFAETLLSVDFTDESTDADGTIDSWLWDFGDTNTSAAQNPTHVFAANGTYSVSLTVTDNLGATDESSQDVTVTDGLSTYPTFEAVSPSAITAASTTGAASLDVAYPAGIDAGEELVILVGIDRDDAAGTTVAGFNRLQELYIDQGGGSIYAALFHRVADGLESGNATITFGNAANDGAAAIMLHVAGGDGNVTPLSSIVNAGTGGSPAAPGNVLDAEKYLLFNMIVVDSNANAYVGDPVGFDHRHDSGSNGTSVSLSVASNEVDGDGIATFGDEVHSSTSGRETVALSLAIKAA